MRFSKIDVDRSGSLTKSEILKIPGLQQNPLVDRVLGVLDVDNNGEIDLNVIFDIYDVNRDGYVTNGELFSVVKSMVGDNLKDVQLQQIVDKTMVLYDSDKDGRISFDEFKKVKST
ncbi:hypothetical protein MXB_3882 [Myxobolus squamalis]|nr:hypothetical protein MXB_3882 [Myxobolus squamalis]